YPDLAVKRSREALSMSHHLLQPSSQALALHFSSIFHQLRREPRAVLACADLCIAISAEQGFNFWNANATMMRGWALSEGGFGPEGMAELRQGFEAWRATGGLTYQTYYRALVLEAMSREGKAKEGLGILDEVLALAEQTGERFYQAELHRLQGVLRLQENGA